MKHFFVILSGLFWLSSQCQQYYIEATIKNIPQKEIYLADFYGEKTHLRDTVIPDAKGNFQFPMKEAYYPGMYRIFLDKEVFFDFIYNYENIKIITDYNYLADSLQVLISEENKLYYKFLRAGSDYRRKFELLGPVVNYFPQNDTFYILVKNKYIHSQNDYIALIDKMISEHSKLWAVKIIRQRKPLYYDPALDEYGRREYVTEHFFDNISFVDVDLIRSNVYTTIAIEYMSLYSNPNLTQEQLEAEFIKAVDRIMKEASENSIIYEFIVEYLVGGFERFHFDKVLDYIAENYSPEQCENEERKTDLQTRLKKYAELSNGKEAPEFEMTELNGNIVKLSKINSEYTLILFWASWCPHCAETMPEIQKIYTQKDKSKLEIVAISLDKERADWEKAVKELNLTWLNCCDLKSWDSQAAIDYNVYATPTMFLLDKNKKIIAKPITLNELKAEFNKIGW
jgi:thiol-disulfide isomerase/thioredoxin